MTVTSSPVADPLVLRLSKHEQGAFRSPRPKSKHVLSPVEAGLKSGRAGVTVTSSPVADPLVLRLSKHERRLFRSPRAKSKHVLSPVEAGLKSGRVGVKVTPSPVADPLVLRLSKPVLSLVEGHERGHSARPGPSLSMS